MLVLEIVYKQIGELRQKGVKMKDIAKHINMAPSVLSAFYSTVLRTYMNRPEDQSKKEALNFAFSLVNNVSQKHIMNNLNDIKHQLDIMDSLVKQDSESNPFDLLNSYIEPSSEKINNLLGIYNSYSVSSSIDGLKIEPIILVKSDNKQIQVARKSIYGVSDWGISIVDNGNTLYLLFNESGDNYTSFISMYIQLPFHIKPSFLRGLYLGLDHSHNPIARRIVLVKVADDCDEDKFEAMKSEIILKEDLSSETKPFYDYTSQTEDSLRMCSIPSIKLNIEDLLLEKKMLSLLFKK